MSKLAKKREKIRTDIGVTGRRALVVEGVDDVAALRIWLTRISPMWESHWVLAEADGKSHVIALAKLQSDWVGLVDRDEMSAVEQADLATVGNLLVLPRFCIESYACVPSELWPTVSVAHKLRHPQSELGFVQFESQVTSDLPNWRRHAALWNVINPLWRRLRRAGFNNDLLNPVNVYDDVMIKNRLNDWANVLAPNAIFSKFQEELFRVQSLPQDEFVRTTVYAKKFYPVVVHAVLNNYLDQAPENERLRDLFKNMPIPADLDVVWQAMGLNA